MAGDARRLLPIHFDSFRFLSTPVVACRGGGRRGAPHPAPFCVVRASRSAFSALHASHSTSGVRRSTFGVLGCPRSARRASFPVLRSAFGVRRSAFAVLRAPRPVLRSPFSVRRSASGVRRSAFLVVRAPRTVLGCRDHRSRVTDDRSPVPGITGGDCRPHGSRPVLCSTVFVRHSASGALRSPYCPVGGTGVPHSPSLRAGRCAS